MLNSRLVFLLLAFHSALSLKKDTKLGKKTLFAKSNCESIKCPAVEQPICTRLGYRNARNKTVYIVMINKCEINYLKCYEGLEASIVPMKNCGHEDILQIGKKRPKRQIENEDSPENVPPPVQGDDGDQSEKPNYETNDVEEAQPEEYEDSPENVPPLVQGDQSEKPNYETNDVEEAEPDEYEHAPENVPPPDQGDDGDQAEELIYEPNGGGAQHEENDNNDRGDGSEDSFQGTDNNLDYEVNEEELDADCPTVCPSRDVMVCGKCQHGVYRTFLSTCHMRMFVCRHTDEKLQLISRLPCVMSAPYLEDAAMSPGAGRVRELSDDDRVLRFIRCRDLSDRSREGDRRCKFSTEKDT